MDFGEQIFSMQRREESCDHVLLHCSRLVCYGNWSLMEP